MRIDWLTVTAQIVNFLVLVWLLKRFLYGPIVRAMDGREQRIKDRLREAEHTKREAEEQARAYRDQKQALAQQQEAILAQAREQAMATRKSMEEAALKEIETRKREWLQRLEEQRESFMHELRRQTTEHFHALARQALSDLANAELQEQIALRFIAQIEKLDETAKENLLRACAAAGESVKVRSRFGLSDNSRRRLTRALNQWLGKELKVDYEASEDVPCGIELSAGNQTISWNLDSYLDGYEKAVSAEFSKLLASSGGAAGK